MSYKPLPDCVEIRPSPVHGWGIFAKKDLPAHLAIGITHYEFGDRMIRTPLGGFYNHSKEPNCERVIMEKYLGANVYGLVTNKEIPKGQELTAKYTLYVVGSEEE